MIKRLDKCSTFRNKKQLTKSIQCLPKLFVNNRLVSQVEMGKSLRYLARYFSNVLLPQSKFGLNIISPLRQSLSNVKLFLD